MGYIYCITNLINSKRYVGKTTTTIDERWQEHCRDSIKERCNKRPLYDAFNKYGIENFKIEELGEGIQRDVMVYILHQVKGTKGLTHLGLKWSFAK